MTNPNVGKGTSRQMENYSSQIDMSELGACCFDLLTPPPSSKFEATPMHTDMLGPEIAFFNEKIGKNSTDYYKEFEELINSIEQTNELEAKITSLTLETPVLKNTFKDQTIDFLYGSVIRDAESALNEIQSQPGTTKSIKMIAYYANQCPFILGLVKQEKVSCMDDNGVYNDQLKFQELQKVEDCLGKLAKCFAEKLSSCKK